MEIFCKYIYKNGRRIYPKRAKSFHFFIFSNKEIAEDDTKDVA